MKVKELPEGWIELESDPGLFTLLLEDFGVRGVDVEEVYDLEAPFEREEVYGFIFLFKWAETTSSRLAGRRGRRAEMPLKGVVLTEEAAIQDMFFALQIAPNSCATHALLSILLNCEGIELGDTLTKLRTYTRGLSPEAKGMAVSSIPELAHAHNKNATPAAIREAAEECGKGVRGFSAGPADQFHFVSYVPIGGHLYELDGLKSAPVDHGEIPADKKWSEVFRSLIATRISANAATCAPEEIRYNLMAVVKCQRQCLEDRLTRLLLEEQAMLEQLEKIDVNKLQSCSISAFAIPTTSTTGLGSQLTNGCQQIASTSQGCDLKRSFSSTNEDYDFQPSVLISKLKSLECTIDELRKAIAQEAEKHQQYRIEASRRTHDYDDFITTFFQLMIDNGLLNPKDKAPPLMSKGKRKKV